MGPFLRYLKAELGKNFPTDKVDVLSYFAVRSEEGAAGTVYRSLLLSLQFLEEAGEVPKDERVSDLPGVLSAVKEFETRRRLQAAEQGEKTGKKQAPLSCSAWWERSSASSSTRTSPYLCAGTFGTGWFVIGRRCGLTTLPGFPRPLSRGAREVSLH